MARAFDGPMLDSSIRHALSTIRSDRVHVVFVPRQDMLGRWSLIPILAVAFCVLTKWKSRQQEIKAERDKLQKVWSRLALKSGIALRFRWSRSCLFPPSSNAFPHETSLETHHLTVDTRLRT